MNVPSSQGSLVQSVRSATLSVELPQPLQLGDLRVSRREYTLVRVTTADGYQGSAYCLSREAPMAALVDRLVAPQLLGRDSHDVPALWDACFRGTAIIGRVGLVRRAIGLTDVALWDTAAQRAGHPLWTHLGTSGEPREAMLVAAYPTADRSANAVADEVLRHESADWPHLKIARSPDPAFMKEVLERIDARIPIASRLVVDVGFGWRDSDEGLRELEAWGCPDLAWLEDPLLPEDVAGCARIRREGGVRVGAGDEVTDPTVLEALIEADAVDVLRVDVIALGGITPTMGVLNLARRRGVPVSAHVYPEVSVHLGVSVETFDRSEAGNPYDPSPMLVAGGPRFVRGRAHPPTGIGAGFTFRTGLFPDDPPTTTRLGA